MFQFVAPLVSLFFFMLGNGVFPSLLALKLNLTPASNFTIGAMSGVFYLGLIVGSLYIEKIICRIGYVRAYVVFASVISMMMSLCGLTWHIGLLLLYRFISGLGTAGVYVVIESWLLSEASPKTRGKVLAFYMIVFYLAHSVGQFTLNLGRADDLSLFVFTSILTSASVIPVSFFKVEIYEPAKESGMIWSSLYRKCHVGVVACFINGALLGAIYGLGPIFFSDVLHKQSDVALFMFAFIFGGMVFQYPIGKCSDSFSKNRLLGILNIFLILTICLSRLVDGYYWIFLTMTGIMGGMILTIYPISISAVCDAIDREEIIKATQNLVVIFSIGGVLGPLIASLFMRPLGPWGLHVFLICSTCVLLFFLSYKKTNRKHGSASTKSDLNSFIP